MPDTPLEQFRAFEFDSNAEWKAYERNVELPANNPAALDKVKAKWYKRNIDPDFDVSLVATSMPRPEPAKAPAPSSTPPPTNSSANNTAGTGGAGSGSSSANQRPGWFGFGGGTSSSSSSSSSGVGSNRPPRFGGPQWVQYAAAAHAMVLVCTLLHLQPLLRPLSATGYTWALRFAIAASLISVYQQFGLPNTSSGLAGLKAWAPPALSSPEFLGFTTQMVYASMMPLAIALVPSCVAAAYAVTAYGAQHHVSHPLWVRYGGRLRGWLLERQAAATTLSALADISVAFLLVVLIATPQRSLLATYFTWSQLKMKYWLPTTAGPQRQAWGMIDQKTRGLRMQFPLLQRGVDFAARWFLAAPGGAPGR